RSGFRPFEGRRRVVIVDDADAMVAPAQNALLKTLEEPPPSSIFVLVTSRPDVLLPTVRSRCIRLVFTGQGTADVDSEVLDVAARVLTHGASGNEAARLEGAKALLEGTGNSAPQDRVTVSTRLRAAATMVRDMAAMDTRAEAGLANADWKDDLERLAP